MVMKEIDGGNAGRGLKSVLAKEYPRRLTDAGVADTRNELSKPPFWRAKKGLLLLCER